MILLPPLVVLFLVAIFLEFYYPFLVILLVEFFHPFLMILILELYHPFLLILILELYFLLPSLGCPFPNDCPLELYHPLPPPPWLSPSQ